MPSMSFPRNLAVMSACQAISMSGSVMVFAVVALAGRTLAPDPALVTLPLGVQFFSMMVGTLPASLIMGRWGRRTGFTVGQILGFTGGILSMLALLGGNFWMFVAAAAPIGIHNSFFQYLRHAAADIAPPQWRARAISCVMAGGVVAGLLGPELAKRSAEALPILFAGPYAVLAMLCTLNIATLQFMRLPRPAVIQNIMPVRSLPELLRDSTFITAVLSAMVGYGVMNLVMVAAPLAMVGCGFIFAESADIIRWHALGMFVPSFFTGHLISHIGVRRVIALGAIILIISLIIALTGIAYTNFLGTLLLLGVGWNFMFLGGTTLLSECHESHERAKVQGYNDLLVFGTTALTSFGSGAVQNALGWQAITGLSLLPLIVVLVMLSRKGRG